MHLLPDADEPPSRTALPTASNSSHMNNNVSKNKYVRIAILGALLMGLVLTQLTSEWSSMRIDNVSPCVQKEEEKQPKPSTNNNYRPLSLVAHFDGHVDG
jgi:hypothetical protein